LLFIKQIGIVHRKIITIYAECGIINTTDKGRAERHNMKGEVRTMKKYTYDVDLHFPDGWDTYQVEAECIDSARYAAVMRVINEISREKAETIDTIRVYKHLSWDLLKEYKVQKR
jgi:hypothetical protein